MILNEIQKKHLRGLGHKLRPVVMVGEAGLSEAVLDEFRGTLAHHELIKVRVKAGDRGARDEIIGRLCTEGPASLVQRIGNMALLYRENPKKKKNKILLPNR